MKKFFKAICLLALLAVFGVPSSALAAPIYNSSVDDFFATVSELGNYAGVTFQGKNYRTTDTGLKVCDINFGGRQDNTVTLSLNSNSTIDNIAINFPGSESSNNAELGGMALALVLITVGFNEQECNKFIEQLNADVANIQTDLEKTYKIYCSAIKQNVNVDAVVIGENAYFAVRVAD